MKAQQTSERSDATKPKRPGKRQGPTSELTTFFKVKKGEEKQLREKLEALDRKPLAERQSAGLKIGTLHEARWVLFDNDTRFMFCTSYDGEWDPYIEDFAAEFQPTFDYIFVHCEGYPEGGIRDPRAKDYVVQQQETAVLYNRFFDATVKDIRKALALQESFNRLLDAPEFRKALESPALKALRETPAFKDLLDHASA